MKRLTDDKWQLGESPIWNYFDGSLVWVDIDGSKLLKFNETLTSININKTPTSIGLIDGQTIFLTVSDGVGIFDFRVSSWLEGSDLIVLRE